MFFIDTKRAYDNKKTTKEKNIDLVKCLGLPVTSYSPAYIFNHSLTNGTRTLSCFLICFTSFSWKFIQRETHDHLKFSPAARLFIYIPIEHSEDRGKQVGQTWYNSCEVEITFCRHSESPGQADPAVDAT